MFYLHTEPIVIFDDVHFVFLGNMRMSCFQRGMKIPLFSSVMNIFLCYNFHVYHLKDTTSNNMPGSPQQVCRSILCMHCLCHWKSFSSHQEMPIIFVFNILSLNQAGSPPKGLLTLTYRSTAASVGWETSSDKCHIGATRQQAVHPGNVITLMAPFLGQLYRYDSETDLISEWEIHFKYWSHLNDCEFNSDRFNP